MVIASITLRTSLVAILGIVVLSGYIITNNTIALAQNSTNATTNANTTNATTTNGINTTSTSSIDKVQVSIVPGSSTLTDNAYSPNPVEVKVGQTVVWTNDDTMFHTVTSGNPGASDAGKIFNSGVAGPTALTTKGKTFEHTFDTTGEFPYFCMLHPNMIGTVMVK